MTAGSARPVGYFVHHQGRGHAERAAALARAIAHHRPVTLFCARPDMLPALGDAIGTVAIPSLFEPTGREPSGLAGAETPDTLHCAPVGWDTITQAIARITGWFAKARPALFVTDVSAELGQLARIASVPHLAVLQHGRRDDPGHEAAYRGAVGLLAPYARVLEQADRPRWMKDKTIYAPGVGIDLPAMPSREAARAALDLPADRRITVVVGGGGGLGLPSAPLTLGARDDPDGAWYTLGTMQSEWHETPPGNLHHMGWVDDAAAWIAAADRIVSSAGNTTVHLVASAGKPWIVVPEWRYFAEQLCKAEALDRAGVAAVAQHWPSCSQDWRRLWAAAERVEPRAQAELVDPDAATSAAAEIEALIARIWAGHGEDAGQPALSLV